MSKMQKVSFKGSKYWLRNNDTLLPYHYCTEEGALIKEHRFGFCFAIISMDDNVYKDSKVIGKRSDIKMIAPDPVLPLPPDTLSDAGDFSGPNDPTGDGR